MVRRRVKDHGILPEFMTFDPAAWPGTSDYQRWLAWDESRQAWAEKNLPKGVEGLPDWDITRFASMPDQPWDEVEHLI